MTATTPAPQPTPVYAPPPPPRHRPIGVTLLAILEFLIGIIFLIAAVGVLALSGYITMITIPPQVMQNIPQWVINLAPMALAFAGVVLLAIGLVSFLLSWGFIRGRNWARVLAIVFLFLSVLSSVFNALVTVAYSSNGFFGLLISILIPILLIWYLTTPKVKAWFIPGYYVQRP